MTTHRRDPEPQQDGSSRQTESSEGLTDGSSKQRRGRPPLAAVLVFPFLLQLALVVGLTAWFSIRHGEQAVEETTKQLRQEMGRRIQDYLLDFLDAPKLINEINAQAIALGELDWGSSVALGRHFRQQLDTFPSASFIFFGSRHGGAAGAGRQADPSPLAADGDGSSPGIIATVDTTPIDPDLGLVAGKRYEYRTDASGERGEMLRSDDGFDSRQRPWYQEAVTAGEAVWTSVYPLFIDHSLALATSRPVRDRQGELLGVVAVDLRLAGIQRFLSALQVGQTGQIFILERDGLLIASSTDEDLLVDPLRDDNWQRRLAGQSQAPLIRQTTESLLQHFGNLDAIQQNEQLTLELMDERHYVEVVPLRDGRGIDWLIVIAVPRSDFTGPLEVSRQRTLWLIGIAFLLAILLGWLTARWLTQPIRRLGLVARQLAGGRLGGRVDRGGSREIDELAGAFNSMAEQLQTSFEDLEQRVASRTEELNQAKETAEAADRAKSRFLANVSHELRTPLSTVLGYSELLAQDPLSSQDRHFFLDAVRQQGRHLSQLLGDLIDLGRIEVGSFELHPETCSLQDLLEQLRSLFAPQATDKGLQLTFDTLTAVPWSFRSDATRLQQILSNLLSNAIRYTRVGKVRCTVAVLADGTAEAVEGTASDATTARLRFEVTDTGIGIAPKDQESLFRHFVRLPAAEAAAATGFGLGLAITRQLCELMDGDIEIDSEPGVGTRFTLTLPIDQCSQWGPAPPNEMSRDALHKTLPPLRGSILIADDSPHLRSLCQHMLEGWGLTCHLAKDGHQAVSMARQQSFDALLMDWQMPGLDGLAATRELRRLGVQVPIVALTAAAMAGDRERCLQAGCSHYLVKPIDFRRLNWLLQDLLQTENLPASPIDDSEVRSLALNLLEGLPGQLRQLRPLIETEDWTGLAAAGHRLAGTLGTYGLTAIADQATQLEEAAKKEQSEDCHQALLRIRIEVDNAIDSMQTSQYGA